jgi:ribosomal protein L16/L10AE
MYSNSLLRLQTGMRGAYGKAHGTAARVKIGQILMSVRSHEYKVSFLRHFPWPECWPGGVLC